jgi:hypothetical protein
VLDFVGYRDTYPTAWHSRFRFEDLRKNPGEFTRNSPKRIRGVLPSWTVPPDTMALFSNYALSNAWTRRSIELAAQRLQAHNDMLYEHLRRNFAARAEPLQDSLLEAIRSAPSKEALSVPLWTYHSTYIADWKASRDQTMAFGDFEGWLRTKGYEWSIGKVRPDFNPETIETVAWEWEWDSRPETVYRIVSKTDLLDRLALLFGNSFVVTRSVIATKSILKPFEAQVYRTELRVHYYPKGLPTAIRDRQAAVRAKYADYRSPVGEGNTHLWTGVPSEVEPGLSNLPPSPPPSVIPPEPPLLPRRTNGGGIGPLVDDVSRRLDFASIHVYEGEDALQRAARDTLASAQDDSAPCHCGYHHPNSEW